MASLKITVECAETGPQIFEMENAVLLMNGSDKTENATFITDADLQYPARLAEQLCYVLGFIIDRFDDADGRQHADDASINALMDYIEARITGTPYQGTTVHLDYYECMNNDAMAMEAAEKAKRYSLLASIFKNGANLLCDDQEHQDGKGGHPCLDGDEA